MTDAAVTMMTTTQDAVRLDVKGGGGQLGGNRSFRLDFPVEFGSPASGCEEGVDGVFELDVEALAVCVCPCRTDAGLKCLSSFAAAVDDVAWAFRASGLGLRISGHGLSPSFLIFRPPPSRPDGT